MGTIRLLITDPAAHILSSTVPGKVRRAFPAAAVRACRAKWTTGHRRAVRERQIHDYVVRRSVEVGTPRWSSFRGRPVHWGVVRRPTGRRLRTVGQREGLIFGAGLARAPRSAVSRDRRRVRWGLFHWALFRWALPNRREKLVNDVFAGRDNIGVSARPTLRPFQPDVNDLVTRSCPVARPLAVG